MVGPSRVHIIREPRIVTIELLTSILQNIYKFLNIRHLFVHFQILRMFMTIRFDDFPQSFSLYFIIFITNVGENLLQSIHH